MISKRKLSLSNKIKESNVKFIEEISLISSEEEIESSSETELKKRMMLNDLDLSSNKTFDKSTKGDEIDCKKSHQNHKLKRSPSPSTKKIKKESNEKNENDNEQLFQMEIQRLIASPAQYCFQPVCVVCEVYTENNSVNQCTGNCRRHFHWQCCTTKDQKENQSKSKSNFKCPDCINEIYRCGLCGEQDDLIKLVTCERDDCHRKYHKTCLVENECFKSQMDIDQHDDPRYIRSCPAHFCVSCVREDPSPEFITDQPGVKKLIQCIRCPLSFHGNDLCMAAGSLELSLSHVICPRHFVHKLVHNTTHKPFHPAWCFKCFKTGVKLLCRYCPSSFHVDCVDKGGLHDNTEDLKAFVCQNCRTYRQPRYGEIAFVKVHQYRWWPCEIIHPRNAPMNILKLARLDGTFPVLFLGSNEYQWVANTRCIEYSVAEHSTIFRDTGSTNRMDREFAVGLKSSIKIHQVFVNILKLHVPLRSMLAPAMNEEDVARYMNVKEPHKTIKFKLIKANILVPPAKLPGKLAPSICNCTDSCQLFVCRNYLNKIECQLPFCPTKTKCNNQQFTNYVNKNLAVFKTTNRGFGFKSMVAIRKNEFIIEYLGELISKIESQTRLQHSKKCNTKEFYMIQLTADLVIDAGPRGNLSRYINHSCEPNCYVENWIVNGYPRKGVFALQNIDPDQELTFDYRISGVIMREDTFCLCGSGKCTGFLGPFKSLSNSPNKVNSSMRLSASPSTAPITESMPKLEDDKIPSVVISVLEMPLVVSELGSESTNTEDSTDLIRDSLVKNERVSAGIANESQVINEAMSTDPIRDSRAMNEELSIDTTSDSRVINEGMSVGHIKEERSTENHIIHEHVEHDFSSGTSDCQTQNKVNTKNSEIKILLVDTGIARSVPDEDEFEKTVHENFCYRCFDGGELVLCDKPGCPKTYHLACLGFEVAPPGTWFCPWHFCDTCGSPSHRFCVQCSSSFCERHASDEQIEPKSKGDCLAICRLHRSSDVNNKEINS